MLACGVVWHGSFAPLFHRYAEWQRATQVAASFESELAGRLASSRAGDVIDAPPLPMWAYPAPGTQGVLGAAVWSDYSVQAWAELAFPRLDVRVTGIEGGVLPVDAGLPVEPGTVRVRLGRRLPGY